MKIAIYIRSVTTARGAEQVSANIAIGLAARGHEVDFLVEENKQGWIIDKLTASGNVSIVNLRAGSGGRLVHRLFQLAAIGRSLFLPAGAIRPDRRWLRQLLRLVYKDDPPIYALHRYIKTHRPEAVLSYLSYPNLVLLMASMFDRSATRYLVSVRNHISTSAEKTASKWVSSVPNLMRRFFHLADTVIAPSAGVAADVVAITGLPEERVRVVHNPIFRSEILTLSEQQPEHDWLHEPTIPVVVAAGKLKPQKDFRTLLNAFSLLRKNRPARLIILGEGAERPMLERLIDELGIGDCVDMPGYVQNPYSYFKNASLFVLSSAWEGLPNVLIEAMACGCPVVATDCPSGPAEILEGGKIGKLVGVGAVDKLAKAMEETLIASSAREVFVERAKAFSFDEAVSGYEKLLTSGLR